MNIETVLKKSPLMPVLVLNDVDKALRVVEALSLGGIKTAEVTLRTPKALEIVTALRKAFPDVLVGVGTVIKDGQLEMSQNAGAQFAISPIFSEAFSKQAKQLEIPYLPAAVTPTEVFRARELGHRFLKFFPAESFDGLKMLKAYQSIFPDLSFCPTGGVQASNFKEYLDLDNVVCVGGSWLVPNSAVEKQEWDKITAWTKEALNSI